MRPQQHALAQAGLDRFDEDDGVVLIGAGLSIRRGMPGCCRPRIRLQVAHQLLTHPRLRGQGPASPP